MHEPDERIADGAAAEERGDHQLLARIIRRIKVDNGKVPLLHWVSRIAVNPCLNQIRHEKRRPEVRLADLSEDLMALRK